MIEFINSIPFCKECESSQVADYIDIKVMENALQGFLDELYEICTDGKIDRLTYHMIKRRAIKWFSTKIKT